MNYAKLFSILIFAALGIYGAIGLYFLPLAGFKGDLTRLAMLPETMFGWTKPQPTIDEAFMHQSSWREADVLVVGDSFSDGRIWQSALTQTGLRVRTESWASVREICEDFMPWLRGQGFNGKYIVFESIERNIGDIAGRSVECKHMQFHHSISADSPRSPPPQTFNPKQADYSGRLSIGIKTRINIWEYEQISRVPGFTGRDLLNGVKLSRIKNGCDLFSHPRCDDTLFLAGDSSEDLPVSTLDNIEKLNKRLPGITPIWVFVPNKSTAYLYPNKQFWNEAERCLGAPNALKAVRQAIEHKTIDLYPANNTHLSTTGYLLLGDLVLNQIKTLKKIQTVVTSIEDGTVAAVTKMRASDK